jgi:hypothetical protein
MTVVTADCAVVFMMTATLHGAATSTKNHLFAGTNNQSTSPYIPLAMHDVELYMTCSVN